MQIVGGQANGDLLVVNPDAILNPDYDINLGDAITGSPVILDNGKIGIATNTNLFLVGNSGIEFSVSTQSRLLGGLITADINRDGSLDLVCVSNRGVLFAVSQSGEHIAGFPVDTGELFNCPPLVADLDGDDQYEIVLHSMVNNIFIYNHDGSLVDGYPFFTSYTGATPGTLLDLENNGYFKLVTGFSNGVLLSNLRAGVSNLAPWTVYRGALNRQASFAATGYVDNEDHVQTPVFDRLSQNYPNPFNP
ncbi:MAG TPA: gingipain R, partial [Candidatus Cloacimonas sp.]|nr:gingipain R [Candidatus Cloacimonas sp.]